MRKLCLFALPFCAAVFFACTGLPALLPIGLAALGLALLFGCMKQLPLCLICAGVIAGLLWFQGYRQLVRLPTEELAGQPLPFTATVTGFSRETSTGSASVEARVHLDGAPDPKVLLYAQPGTDPLSPGDVISGTARFTLSDIVRGEASTYYEAQGIYLRAQAVGDLSVTRPDTPPFSVWPAYTARALQQSVIRIFPEDVSAFMCALLTGDKSGLSDSIYQSLQRSGAAHIVAVSGLHLSFFAGLLALAFPRRSRAGALATLLLVFLFAAVAGFTPSVMRAAFMVAFTQLAPLAGREEDKPTTLCAALTILLLLNPYSAQSVSLQLSFGAVAGIYTLTKPLYRAMTRSLQGGGGILRRAVCALRQSLAANLSVTLGALLLTTPLTAIHFGTVSLISPLTNLLVLWAVSAAFSAGLILTLLGLVLPTFASFAALPVTLLIRFVLSVTGALGRLSFASLPMDSIYLAGWLVLVYSIIILMVLYRYRKPAIPLCVGAVTLCAALLLTRLSFFSAPLSVTVLDVGQGQCILLQSGGCTALIDCGGSKDNAGDIAANYLQGKGVSKLDLLVLTHCHSDHANGVSELFERLEISSMVLPFLSETGTSYRQEILAAARSEGIRPDYLYSDTILSLGESTLTLYAPLGDGGTNEEGLFVLVTCGDFDLLITGDANSSVETLLLRHAALPDIEVLVAGHHGSSHSTCELLLDTVTPETCLISVGYNPYGHPARSTLNQLTQRNIDVYRTDLMGNLTLRYHPAKETEYGP